ncbi:hypothetical protein PV327_008227 [Microctonus hyperodae]|uniref:PDZ domain-containing protein n=1 Tax=Microctonus hyperodae TaxID=165561 RepID=A0AA39KGS1_MICHY|nr:hypothetical protein PV327_008227 [Microctonus hyperodae]
MDNCGGGQRLPPDGDEFPAAYQEFSASSQQLQSLGAPRSTTTLIFNGENEMYNGKHTNGNLQTEESRVTTQYIITNSKEMTATEIVDDKNLHSQDIVRRNTTTNTTNIYSSLNNKSNDSSTIVLTEQTIEIAGYYPKESRMEMGGCGKDYPDNPPPPLPLTGPPKMEKPVPFTRSTSTDNSSRKFSLNNDPRRQDDKSEKSVRDKIAMFSSQSNLEAPLFPTSPITTIVTNTGRRLSKYKSTEDFFNEERDYIHHDRSNILSERTLSSSNLLNDDKTNDAMLVIEKRSEISSSLPQSSSSDDSTFSSTSITMSNSILSSTLPKLQYSSTTTSSTDIKTTVNSSKPLVPQSNPPQDEIKKVLDEPTIIVRSSMPTLTRATSFSGGISFNGDLSSNNNNQISRTNSLASTFRRNSEDMRRTSLNQLIEQRKKGISKLRGLVIPEKDTVSIDQPIIDLPEIKSRDSILLQQMSKANIQDKWGSQSSLASNTSTQSVPIKTTTSFKMPPPQILPKYSPAFKRKSLAVYGTSNNTPSNTMSPTATQQTSQMSASTPTEAPKSLESICSPTRSDYSFEYLSSSVSPENLRNRQRINPKKIRGDYDDSDNDSAVSSSQSSISRGFSPPSSPVPSERSILSSERSYPTSFIMETPARNYLLNDRSQFNPKSVAYSSERIYQHGSNISSTDSNSGGSNSNSRSPPPESNSLYSPAIAQRELLKRSSSTETNYSTSSTLTSGSQASAESLSRRVLKPQSVEAINRKNILASARCRSGKNLNGSPLIQRKFSDDKTLPASTLSHENGNSTSSSTMNDNNLNNSEIKIAYVDIIDNFTNDQDNDKKIEEPKLPPKKIISTPVIKLSPKPEMILQPSNDLKMWVRSEAKAMLIKNSSEQLTEINHDESSTHDKCKVPRSKSSSTLNESTICRDSKIKPPFLNGSNDINNIKSIQGQNEDLLATLTTRSRSRAPINLDDSSILRAKGHMSLEDILTGKITPQTTRSDSQLINSPSYERLSSDDGKPLTRINSKELLSEKTFISKIPTYGRQKISESFDETNCIINERSKASKIPLQKSLGRRSASVTDMKKAIDKPDYTTGNNNSHSNNHISSSHQRFSSLDSSVGSHNRSNGSEIDAERLYSEHFGSISSLASSTSLISQQELAQLVEEATLDDPKGSHDLIVVLLHKENPSGSVGITLAGGIDCETKEISVHRVLAHSIADKDGRVHRGDRILSINGKSTRGLSHRESLAILKQPRSEIVLVISRAKIEDGNKMRSRTDSVETIVEGYEVNGAENTVWGPQIQVTIFKDGAGLGFSLEGGRDSPLGDRPLVVKKIFTGGAAEKTGTLTAGDQLLEVNGTDVTRMSRIEAWSLMKKLHDGNVILLVRHPATKSS